MIWLILIQKLDLILYYKFLNFLNLPDIITSQVLDLLINLLILIHLIMIKLCPWNDFILNHRDRDNRKIFSCLSSSLITNINCPHNCPQFVNEIALYIILYVYYFFDIFMIKINLASFEVPFLTIWFLLSINLFVWTVMQVLLIYILKRYYLYLFFYYLLKISYF